MRARSITAQLLFFAVLSALLLMPAKATEYPAFGGPGDAGFRDECPPGHAIVGFSTRTGSLMDQITTLCAPRLADGTAGERIALEPHGGLGGAAGTVYCSGNGAAQFARYLGVIFSSDGRRIAAVIFVCDDGGAITASNESHCTASVGVLGCSPEALDQRGMNYRNSDKLMQQCTAADEFLIGIHGRYGKHVNAMGAICNKIGPLPPPPPPPFDIGAQSKPSGGRLNDMTEKGPARTTGKTKLDSNIYTSPDAKPKAPPASATPAQPATPPTQPPLEPHDSFTGVWDTVTAAGVRYTMKLTQQRRKVSGSYARPDGTGVGTIEGKVKGGTLTYRWKERGGEGSGRFKLGDDGNGFAGWWNSIQQPDEVEGSWNGTRR